MKSLSAIGLLLMSAFAFDAAAQSVTTDGSNRVLRTVGGTGVPKGLGLNVHFDEGHADDLDLIASMGFKLVRKGMLWTKVEAQKGVYDWKPYDALVADSRARGITPLLILAYSNPLYAPVWRGGSGRQDWAFEPPTTDHAREAFVAFARAAAQRYRGQVIWEIWNEPNLTFGKPFNADAYLRLARDSCRAMRDAYADATIVGPASNGFAMGFLEEFIKNDGEGCFDAISLHPYRDWDPDSALRDWHRLDVLIEKLQTGRRMIAIDSEWGYSVQRPPWTERRQAEYVLRLYLTDLLAGVPITIVYDYRNDGVDPRDKEQNYGLFDFHGRPKAVATALGDLVRELKDMTVLGKVRLASPDISAVAFGSPDGRVKIVAWSASSAEARLNLPGELCVTPAHVPANRCESLGLTLMAAPTSLRVSGAPAVAEIQTVACSLPRNASGSLADWCTAYRNASR